MKQKKILRGIVFVRATCAQANNYTVTSPDGKLAVNVECKEGKAFYTVNYDGKQMLGASALGLVANYGDFSQNLKMGALKSEKKHQAYKLTRTKKEILKK